MKHNTLCRILACILLLACPITAIPVSVQASQVGTFALCVLTQEHMVIEPEFVSYKSGDTIGHALQASGHEFVGLDTGYVAAIDGVTDNYCLFYDGGDFDLEVPAEQIRALCFTTLQEQYSENYLDLLTTMANYNSSQSGVKDYPKAQEAYKDALSKMYGASIQQADTLRATLQQAVEQYDAHMRGETVLLQIVAQQNGIPAASINAVFTGSFGNVVSVQNQSSVSLLPDTYRFDISDGSINHVRGEINITQAQTLTVTLPHGEWIADLKFSIASGTQWAALKKVGTSYYAPDYAGENLFPYITPGENVDTTACAVYLADSPNATRRTWLSKQTTLSGILPKNSMESCSFALEARLQDGNYEQYQRYPVEIVRIPTLRTLSVYEGDTCLPLAFSASTAQYSLTTVSDSLRICADPLCEEASVCIDGTWGTEKTVRIETEKEIPVVVSHADGQRTQYTISVKKVPAVHVRLEHEKGVEILVLNAAKARIAPIEITDTAAVYALIPDEPYTYVSTVKTYYHTTAGFTAEEALTVSVPTPQTTDWLRTLHVGPTKTVRYACDYFFSPDRHDYTYFVGSNQTTFGILPTLNAAYSMTAYYTDYRTWEPAYGDKELPLASGAYRSANALLGASGLGNRVRLAVQMQQDGVTYYQDYFLSVQRTMQLNSLSVCANEQELILTQDDGKQGFDKQVLSYTASIGQMQENLRIALKLFGNAGGHDNEIVVRLQSKHDTQMLNYAELEVQEKQDVVLALDLEAAEEHVQITVERDGAIAQTYQIRLEKKPPVAVSFHLQPENAVVTLEKDKTHRRLFPGETQNTFTLDVGESYTYTVSCYGYLAQTASFVAGFDADTVRVSLQEAPENSRKDLLQDGDWPSFRGNAENNGITNAPTPTTAEGAVLNWANKLGDGFSAGAVGSPILVGDTLYTYAADSVMKVDKSTGELLLAKPMDRSSSFSITPPAYGEGMLFVALANGAVQAFDAQTLDSLWLYEDALGGQPNCPITYHNGYIYTGFWNAEAKQANFVCISVTDEDPTQPKEKKLASWTFTDKGFYWAGAYVCDSFVLVTTDDGQSGYTTGHGDILSLDTRTGCQIDRQTAAGVGDLRSTICYDSNTDAYYFTSKGGEFYRLTVRADGTIVAQQRLALSNGANDPKAPAMSTSTPVICNGRAYIGVSGTSQFGAYSGHNITVIDLPSWKVAYTVPTQGYPQTSGLLTTAYAQESGFVYVYFIDNYTPGKLRVLRDKPGMTAPDPTYLSTETYSVSGKEYTVQTAYTLFTPSGAQAQYAICSPIADQDGNLYFKNDSAYLMCLGSAITALTVSEPPEQVRYEVGQCFDPTGLQVTAQYANGMQKDVTKFIRTSQEALTLEDTELTLTYCLGEHEQMYQDRNEQCGVPYFVPTATIDLTMFSDHVWDEGKIIQQPSATENGEKIYTCALCGSTKTEMLPATGKCDGSELCPSHEMTDVPLGAWFHSSVDYVIAHKLMMGTGNSLFQPGAVMTRSQLVTILWRECGSPDPQGENPFVDLQTGWYFNAVVWAAENQIVSGTGKNCFQPSGELTREQLATILERYARDFMKLDTASVRKELDNFADASAVSAWAKEAMQWAVGDDLIRGSTADQQYWLKPKQTASRAEVAAILMRFLEKHPNVA